MEQKLLNVVNNLCNGMIADGTVHEEVIDMLVDAGADKSVLLAIGFTQEQIGDYVYYISMLDDVSEESVLANL